MLAFFGESSCQLNIPKGGCGEHLRAADGCHDTVGAIARLLCYRLIGEGGDEDHAGAGGRGVERDREGDKRRDLHLG